MDFIGSIHSIGSINTIISIEYIWLYLTALFLLILLIFYGNDSNEYVSKDRAFLSLSLSPKKLLQTQGSSKLDGYTTNVLSVEITDVYLRSKSNNKHLLIL